MAEGMKSRINFLKQRQRGKPSGAEQAKENQEGKRWIEGIKGAISNLWKNPILKKSGVDVAKAKEKFSASKFYESLKQKKVFGRTLDTLIPAISGAAGGVLASSAISALVRHSLGTYSGGLGYIVAGAAGGVSGAVVEGFRASRRESKRDISRDEFVEQARKLRLKVNNLSKEKQLVNEKDAVRLNRLSRYIQLAESEATETLSKELSVEKQKLYAELKKDVVKSRVRKAILKGAVIGAVGGTIGEGLMNLFGFREVTEAAVDTAQSPPAEAFRAGHGERMERFVTESFAKHYETAVKGALDSLSGKEFTAVIGQGEGLTHIARNAIHDYIVQSNALGVSLELDKAQLVYAEDWLQKQLALDPKLTVGQEIRINGDLIKQGIEKASELSAEQVQNLNNEWVGKISEQTWQGISDYSGMNNSNNAFSQGIFDSAKSSAAEAAKADVARFTDELARAEEVNKKAYELMSRGAGQAAGEVVTRSGAEPASKAATDWLSVAAIAGGTAVITATGLLSYAAYKTGRKAVNALRTPKGSVENLLVKYLTSKNREKIRDKINASLQKVLERNGVPAEIRSRTVEAEIAKLDADPYRKACRDLGLLKAGEELLYRMPKKGPDGKFSAANGFIDFTNYHDLRIYNGQLPENEYLDALVIRDSKGKRILGIISPARTKRFFKLDRKDAARTKITNMFSQLFSGELADTYVDPPQEEATIIEQGETELKHRKDFTRKLFSDDADSASKTVKPTQDAIDAAEKVKNLPNAQSAPKIEPGPQPDNAKPSTGPETPFLSKEEIDALLRNAQGDTAQSQSPAAPEGPPAQEPGAQEGEKPLTQAEVDALLSGFPGATAQSQSPAAPEAPPAGEAPANLESITTPPELTIPAGESASKAEPIPFNTEPFLEPTAPRTAEQAQDEKLAAELIRRRVPERLRSRSWAEEMQKRNVDALMIAVKEAHLDQFGTAYRCPIIEDLNNDDVTTIRHIWFTNYSDYREYLEGMTVDQYVKASTLWGKAAAGEEIALSVVTPWDKDLGKVEYEQRQNIVDLVARSSAGILGDPYLSKSDAYAIRTALAKSFNEKYSSKFDVTVSDFDEGLVGTDYAQRFINNKGLRNLMTAFTELSSSNLKFGNAVIKMGDRGIEVDGGRIEINVSPYSSVQPMKDFLIRAADRIKEIEK